MHITALSMTIHCKKTVQNGDFELGRTRLVIPLVRDRKCVWKVFSDITNISMELQNLSAASGPADILTFLSTHLTHSIALPFTRNLNATGVLAGSFLCTHTQRSHPCPVHPGTVHTRSLSYTLPPTHTHANHSKWNLDL